MEEAVTTAKGFTFIFASEDNTSNQYTSTSAAPSQSLVTLYLITRTRKQWNESQRQAMKLQTILNYSLQRDSLPPQDSAVIHYTDTKKKKDTKRDKSFFPPNSSAAYSTKHTHRYQRW